jgi:large subunit ribosomal protein L31e
MFKVKDMADIERIYTIPLTDARKVPRWKRAESAVRKVRAYLAKHLKTDIKDVKIDSTINEKLWERGSMKPPLKIRVRAVKFEAGGVESELAQE